jgi:hypothetical protein
MHDYIFGLSLWAGDMADELKQTVPHQPWRLSFISWVTWSTNLRFQCHNRLGAKFVCYLADGLNSNKFIGSDEGSLVSYSES